MSKVFIEESTLTAIGNAIRTKTGGAELIPPLNMATAINNITTGDLSREDFIPDEAFDFSGDCVRAFAGWHWKWFIEQYGSEINAHDLTDCSYMFFLNSGIKEIPFEFNFVYPWTSYGYYPTTYMFSSCRELTSIGKFVNWYPSALNYMFTNCDKLRELPELVNTNWNRIQTYNYANCSKMFSNCYSLRKIPSEWLENLWGIQTSSSSTVSYGFCENCFALDELVGFVPQPAEMKDNMFGNANMNGTVGWCYRLKDFIFATQEDGTPYVRQWKNQSLDLRTVGWANTRNNLLQYNSGITADKEVKDDATYQALKDDPDWFTINKPYCRYNHDSAVRTIASLPDTSEYLAQKGGTNTITFLTNGGEKTDGGACSTLTEEEIAVAAAKGWTVAYNTW